MQVQRIFRPELLNRMTEIVIFEPLSHEQMKEVARIQIKTIVAKVANKGISLFVNDAMLDVILLEPHNPVSISSLFYLFKQNFWP
jgi:ATP-dependent Clp protease ATP-binding subunit ClpA